MEPYIPETLPLNSIKWNSLLEKITEANSKISEYSGMLSAVHNPGILLSPMSTQEAVLSSKIEGTQATLEEVLRYEADPGSADKNENDIIEVINYRKAMDYALEAMNEKPVNLNMIKKMHGILLSGVRGHNKRPGEFRKDQNFIGMPGAKIENARYVPPTPLILDQCLDNFINYFHFQERDKVVQAAVMHAQFEIIHPFGDGNGRVGRLLIPLFLFEKKKVSFPVFYISAFFDRHRDEYYFRLKEISEKKDWEGWINFFLDAVIEQASENMRKVSEIMVLYDRIKKDIGSVIKTRYAIDVLDALFKTPFFTSRDFSEMSGIPHASTARIIKNMVKKGILTEARKGAGRRPAIIYFEKLIKIIND